MGSALGFGCGFGGFGVGRSFATDDGCKLVYASNHLHKFDEASIDLLENADRCVWADCTGSSLMASTS